jgi:hypothetical protein
MILKSTRASKNMGYLDFIISAKDDKEMLSYIQKVVVSNIKNPLHFSNFLVAQVDDKLVGSLCSYEPRISTREALLEALLEAGIDASENESLRVLNLCGFEPNTKILVFDFMEEIDGFVDAGVLKALMQKSLLTARLKGYRLAQTVVEIGALETLMYYKKLGFKELKQKECEAYKELFGRAGLVLLSVEF